jgi:general secretion pathway protein L
MAKRAATSFLQIHLPERWPDPAAPMELPVRWSLQDGSRFDDGVSRLDDVPRADEVVAVLPVARVLFASANLPRGPAAKLARVVPYAIEEAIAPSPEDIHAVVLDETRADGEQLVAALDRKWLASVVAALESNGLSPSKAIVESALIPHEPDVWTVVWTGNSGFAALGSIEAIALDAAADARPPLALKLMADERRARGAGPREVRVLLAGSAPPPDGTLWSESLHAPVTLGGRWLPEEINARLAPCPNLLPGRAATLWSGSEWPSRLRPALMFAAGILAIHVSLTAVDWWRLWHEARTVRGDMEAAFRKAFPEAKSVVDPALQMSRNVAELRRATGQADAGDLMPMLAKLAPALAETGAKLQALKYERGAVELELAVPAEATRESLAGRLKAPGLAVKVERVSTAGAGPSATVRVAPEGA